MLREATIQISMELWGGILCLIFAAFIFFLEEEVSRRGKLLLAILLQVCILLFCDTAAWAYRGREGVAAYYVVRISNYLVFTLNYVIGFTTLEYLQELLAQKGETITWWMKLCVRIFCLLGISVVSISQFTDFLYFFREPNLYTRAEGYWLITVVAGMMQVSIVFCILCSKKKLPPVQYVPLLLIFGLIFLAYVVQSFSYGISFVNFAMTLGVLILFFAYEKERIRLSVEQEKLLLEHTLRVVQQEAELAKKDAQMATINAQLAEKRTQIMLSQIQPHFLYNTLSAISFLCIKDPMKAKETTDSFAAFLRTNLNSLGNDHLVSFDQELEHTKAYLSIEQTRFGEELRICYDIQCSDFLLPSLSLQPVVENAVRHGICAKEDGGTVTIGTRRMDGKIYITVTDDGVGFDTNAVLHDGKIHIGIKNVTQRLKLLCDGQLIVSSVQGQGTTVTIILPDKKGAELPEYPQQAYHIFQSDNEGEDIMKDPRFTADFLREASDCPTAEALRSYAAAQGIVLTEAEADELLMQLQFQFQKLSEEELEKAAGGMITWSLQKRESAKEDSDTSYKTSTLPGAGHS